MSTLRTFAIAALMVGFGLAVSTDGRAGPVAVCDGHEATITGAGAINGTPGDDVIVGSGGADTINGRGGDDVICGGGGNDVIHGNSGNDRIFGEDQVDHIFGDAGNDHLDLGFGPADIGVLAVAKGGTGNDYLTSPDSGWWHELGRYNGWAQLDGGAGDDTIEAEAGHFMGGSGNDHLIGGSGLLEGGSGNDILSSSDYTVTLNGGSGNDRLTAPGTKVYFIAGSGSDICDCEEGTTSNFLISCEQVI